MLQYVEVPSPLLKHLIKSLVRPRGNGHHFLHIINGLLVGEFAKLRKATINFVMPVRLSARMEQFVSHWTDFYEIVYLKIFQKSVEKIQVSLKSDNNNGTLRED